MMFNRRVPKTDLRVAAYGACDELNVALGMARAWSETPEISEKVLSVQKELVILMGELACTEADRTRYIEKGFQFVEETAVDRLTAWIDDLEKNRKISFKQWATPGACKTSALLDQARVVCRRAEREVWRMKEAGILVGNVIPRYLNRFSDLCWLWARMVETEAGLA